MTRLSRQRLAHGTCRLLLKSSRGQLLLTVLWVMGLVSLAVGGLAVRSLHELRLGGTLLALLQCQGIAQAAAEQAIRVIQQDTKETPQSDTVQEPWAIGRDASDRPLFENIQVGNGIFSIGQRATDEHFVPGLIDEERKLNVNLATQAQLQRLLAFAGSNFTATPDEVVSAIMDWRDEATGSWCNEQQLGYPCHNGLLDSVEELRLVPGMTPALFSALEPYITIYGDGRVNANTAEPLVLKAWGLSEEQADTVIQQRKTQPFDTGHPPPSGLGATSSHFLVEVEARSLEASAVIHLRVVLDRDGHILYWSPR